MRRRGEISTIVLVFAVPAVVLFPWVHVRTTFTASLQTRSIQFTTGPWKTSAGLFNSDETSLDLIVEDFDRIESLEPSHSVLKGSGPVTLQRVCFHSLDVNQRLRIQLDASEDGELGMKLERLDGSGDNSLASFRSDAQSRLPAALPQVKGTRSSEWAIYGKQNHLHLTLRPLKDKIRAESRIPLSDGSIVTFENAGQSAITASPDAQLTVLDRKLKLEGQSLLLGGLKQTSIESLAPAAQGIKVVIARGRSDNILLNEANQAATLAEYLTSQKPLATYLSTVALIGSTLLTILTRLKLVKGKD